MMRKSAQANEARKVMESISLEPAAPKLAMFDFDETLTATDSITWLFSSLQPGRKEEVRSSLSNMKWLEWQNHWFQELKKHGLTPWDILKKAEEVPLLEGASDMLASLKKAGFKVVIISDSNDMVIRHVLRAHPAMQAVVSEIYSNSAQLKDGGFEVQKCQGFDFGPGIHLDKRVIAQKLMDKMSPKQAIYAGDGRNDLAGVSTLRQGDIV